METVTKLLLMGTPAHRQKHVWFALTVVFCRLLVWFLGGGLQAAFWKDHRLYYQPHPIPCLRAWPFIDASNPQAASTAEHRRGPFRQANQMTRKSNRMITIRMIRLMPPPP